MRRGPVAVVTNFDDTATAYDILARHGILARVDAVVVSEAVGLRSRTARSCASRSRARRRADEPVMIGDHALEDVGAAAAAGVDAVWIDRARRRACARGHRRSPRYVVRALPERALALLGC